MQERLLGTGDARSAPRRRRFLEDVDDLLALSGDTPLLTNALLDEPSRAPGQRCCRDRALVPVDVRSYGRIVRDADGALHAIVEAADATPEQLELREANSSIYVSAPQPCGRRSSGSHPRTPRASST